MHSILIGLFVSLFAQAQDASQPVFVYPCLYAKGAITIDGTLSSDEWRNAVEISGFTLSKTGKLIREQTVAYALYDESQLYIGVKCIEPRMKNIVARVKDWDGPVWRDDAVEIFVDPGHTEKEYFQFIVNALGTGYDGKRLDPLWSGKWKCAAKKSRNSWSVEAAIPFESLGQKPKAPGEIWGINICRERRADKSRGLMELLNWSNVMGNFHRPHMYGHLLFVDKEFDSKSSQWKPVADVLGPSRIFVADGYWDLDKDGKSQFFTYRSLLKEKIKSVPDIASLKQEFDEQGAEVILMRFRPIEDQVARIKRLIAGSKPVRAESWAVNAAIIDGLESQLGEMYWRIKLDLLIKEL